MPDTRPYNLITDFWTVLHLQGSWAERTFGPGLRTKGLTEHIRKELVEVEADPESVEEWVDVLILAFDGARRAASGSPGDVLKAYIAKMEKNFNRTWPDWQARGNSEDTSFQHIEETTNE